MIVVFSQMYLLIYWERSNKVVTYYSTECWSELTALSCFWVNSEAC